MNQLLMQAMLESLSVNARSINIQEGHPIGWMYDALPGDIIMRPKQSPKPI